MRDRVINQAMTEANRIKDAADEDARMRVAESELTRDAQSQADAMILDAQSRAERMLAEAEAQARVRVEGADGYARETLEHRACGGPVRDSQHREERLGDPQRPERELFDSCESSA